MQRVVTFTVPGIPRPQGSKKHVGRGILVESSPHLKEWRGRVACEAHMAWGDICPWTIPVIVELEAFFPRPAGQVAKKTGLPKPRAPMSPTSRICGDVDKLSRAVLDALTGVLYADDSQVVQLLATKRYADDGQGPRLRVSVEPWFKLEIADARG